MTIQTILTDLGLIVGALLAIDNVLDGVFKYFGWTKWDTACANFARFLQKILGQLPKAGAVILFCLICGTAQAQTTPVSISDILSHVTAHEAVGYDIKSKNAVSYTSVDLLDWKMLALSGGYTTSSGIVGSFDVDLGGLSQFGINSPILSVIDLRVGFMVGMDDLSTATSGGSAERNKLVYGPEVTLVSTKF